MNYYTGYQKISADAVVNTSGRPVAIWGVYVESGTGGAAVVSLYDGTSTSGTKVMQVTGITDDGFDRTFPRGIVFSNGCFVDVDSNTSFATIRYETLS